MKLPIVIRIYRNDLLETVKQFTETQIVLGSSESSQIKLSGDEIAPLHAVIEERDSGFYISDLGSSIGTNLNGNAILDEKIVSGDSINLGTYRVEFFVGIPKPTTRPENLAPVSQRIDDHPKVETGNLNQVIKPANESRSDLHIPKGPPEKVAPNLNFSQNTSRVNTANWSQPNSSPQKPEEKRSASKIPQEHSTTTPKLPFERPENPVEVEKNKFESLSSKAHKPASVGVVTANSAGTFAPASDIKNLTEILRPGKGTVIEVVVAWKERILTSYHFNERGMVRIGSGLDNEIVLPILAGTLSHSLIRIDALATVCVSGEMSGELITETESSPFSKLMRQNRLIRNNIGFEINLQQGEMLRIGIQGDLINIYVRYVAEVPKPLVAPLIDLTASEVTAVILAAVVSLTFGLYMMVYAPKKLDEEALIEEPIRKAVVIFNAPRPKPITQEAGSKTAQKVEKQIVKVADKKPEQAAKAPVKVPEKKPQLPKQSVDQNKKMAEVRPNPSQPIKKKTLTSTRQGGAVKTGKSGASPTSEKVDVSKVGLLGTFGSRGTRSKLDKAYSGAGELSGLAESATGFAGQVDDRVGDDIGTKLKNTGAGGKGSATVGIANLGTTGKGSGAFSYGAGDLGEKTRVEVQLGGEEALVDGFMDREAIRRVILANKRVIRNCYEMALARSPDLYGKLVIEWLIEEKGRVARPKVVSNSLGSDTVANCLIKRLKTWRFPDPPPDKVGQVTYPFVFVSQ